MENNTTGTRNLAIGYAAYDNSDTENDNIAIGYNAMTVNTAGGTLNIAIGSYAGDAITSADDCVIVGHNAGTAITSAGKNTVVGRSALEAETTGGSNSVFGYKAMEKSNGGSQDSAFGHEALRDLTDGFSNNAFGSFAGAEVTTGDYNVFIGNDAGSSGVNTTTGSKNIMIGCLSHGAAAGTDNQLVMGYNVVGINDAFTFGNAASDSSIANGATSISAPSDIRLKENIQDETIGLDFINDLRPVTFQWKKAKDISDEMELHDPDSDERVMNGKFNHGFIAQEVKAVIDNHSDIKDGFGMWSESGSDNRQRIAEGELMSILVKSVQELSAKNDSLETSNQALIARIEALENA
jgi:hypothetical protein